MIDRTKEPAISLAEVTKLPELQRNGKRPHVATIFRWTTRGCRGVRLESIQIGGTRCSTLAAVRRFLDSLSGVEPQADVDRDAETDAAERELARAGI
jgi:hypothetical protein